MTLTTVVGSSGSGKTTFLNDVYKSHKCIYIRQYHNIRPYMTVSKIPNFDPSRLPYWNIYENEGKSGTILIGGTFAGEFTAGLSGGQRKMLLFELISQRVAGKKDLLIVLDEPFAGVTDEFVPFIVERLEEMRKNHNILLVTNDHIGTLTSMADNTITVSAVDRSHVHINDIEQVEREKAIAALSVGDEYAYQSSGGDMKFFFDVEVLNNPELITVAAFTVFAYSMILLTFWNSADTNAALVLNGAFITAFFCVNPYLLALVEWRIVMIEEAEALVHSSKEMNMLLKSSLTFFLIVTVAFLEYGIVNAVVKGFESFRFAIGILTDNASMTVSFIALGIYTKLSFEAVQILSVIPFLSLIFFSTTFSPGGGIEGLKALRFLYARFYLWCIVPYVKDEMEGCPSDDMLVTYMIVSSLLGIWLFVIVKLCVQLQNNYKQQKSSRHRYALVGDEKFQELQVALYGTKALRRFQHLDSIQNPSPRMEAEEKEEHAS